jgi:hypothetical protein
MPRVRISIGDLKCVRQADSLGTDDVYWIANLRSAPSLDQRHTEMARLRFDDSYRTSQPEMLAIGTGQTKRFANNIVYEEDVPSGSYVFGAIHFVERDTPMSNYFAKLASLVGLILGGLALAAVLGFGIGFWMAGLTGAFGGAIVAASIVGVMGFVVGALIESMRPVEGDVHLGGIPITVGPIGAPPPNSDKEAWQLVMTPAGKLEVVDAHGAELVTYPSSHLHHAAPVGHRYETTLQLEITGGHR